MTAVDALPVDPRQAGRDGAAIAALVRIAGGVVAVAALWLAVLAGRTWLAGPNPAMASRVLEGWAFALHLSVGFLVIAGVTAMVAPAAARRPDWRLLAFTAAAGIGLGMWSAAAKLHDLALRSCADPPQCSALARPTEAWRVAHLVGWATVALVVVAAIVARTLPADLEAKPRRGLNGPLALTVAGVAVPVVAELALWWLGPHDTSDPSRLCTWTTNTAVVLLAGGAAGLGLTAWGMAGFARRRWFLALPVALTAVVFSLLVILFSLVLVHGGAGWCESD